MESTQISRLGPSKDLKYPSPTVTFQQSLAHGVQREVFDSLVHQVEATGTWERPGHPAQPKCLGLIIEFLPSALVGDGGRLLTRSSWVAFPHLV